METVEHNGDHDMPGEFKNCGVGPDYVNIRIICNLTGLCKT